MTQRRELARQIRDGAITAVAACEQSLDRIKTLEPSLSAFNTVMAERALDRARALDAAGRSTGPLHGVPIALKDNMSTAGVPTTASSRILSGYVPPYDATVVTRLEAAGAIVIGKTNLDEFAMGSSTENSALGPTRNAWDPTRTPGGSSGGSATAVAVAHGAPGAWLGHGRIDPTARGAQRHRRVQAELRPRVAVWPAGVRLVARSDRAAHACRRKMPHWCSRSSAGPIAAMPRPVAEPMPDALEALTGDVKGLRIGVPKAFLGEGVDAEVLRAFNAALQTLAARGATLVDIELPHAGYGIPVYYLIATAEASSNLARYDGVRYGYRAPLAKEDGLRQMYERTRSQGFGPEVKRRIMLGTYVLSAGYYDAYYLKAQQVRTLLRQDHERAFERVDVVATPTTPTPAFTLGEKTSDPLQMYLNDIFTVSANLTGLPAISVPCGFSSGRLPIGMQLTGRMFDEVTVLRAADAYQRDTVVSH